MVPADAAFYSASLRLKEQLDIFLESNAYAKLMEIPLVQLAKMQVEFQWQQAALPGVARIPGVRRIARRPGDASPC